MPRRLSNDSRQWTRADWAENQRLIDVDNDQSTWNRLGRLVRVRGRDLKAAFARLVDERLDAFIERIAPTIADRITNRASADTLRECVVDLILPDMIQRVRSP